MYDEAMRRPPVLLLLLLGLTLRLTPAWGADVRVCFDAEVAPLQHAAEQLKQALETQNHTVSFCAPGEAGGEFAITLSVQPETGLEPGGFAIRSGEGGRLDVIGGDAAGAVYGGLAVAADVRSGAALDEVEAREENPRVGFRAIKFNLPWDSYRRSEALQLHTETVRDLRFWERFLDMMAENRFNVLSLWNLHPFSYMVRSETYPEATPFSDEELAGWQDFYRGLFRMAKERGIETYVVNWNIFVSPAFAEAHDVAPYSVEGRYFADGDTSAIIKDYTREVVTQVINAYPDLTGLGVSLGEGMGGMTPQAREDWVLQTIIAGMQDADREAKLIHRVPFSAGLGSGGSTSGEVETLTREALETIEGVERPIWVEVKFNWSHAHSTPKLVKVHGGPIKDTYWNPPPERYKLAWMMRNEDFFALRWGVPDFIREHVRQNLPDYVGGYFVGSECYIPAVDYFTKGDAPVAWDYAFERQWLFYQLWGRLLYDPDTPDAVFEDAFTQRYGAGAAPLLRAYALASQMPLRLASFYDATWDFTLYSEGFLSKWGPEPTRFIDVDRLIENGTLDPAYLSIPEYVEAVGEGRPFTEEDVTPLQLADTLERDAQQALALAAEVDPGDDASLRYEVADVEAWAHLGLYFAEKLRGGVALHAFRTSGEGAQRDSAVAHLERAARHWGDVVAVTEPLYREMPLTHLIGRDDETFHWSKLQDAVRRDVEIAREAVPPSQE